MTEYLAAAGLGLGLGIVTGMPLGVINVAVVDAAAAGDVPRATRIGAGGAIADAIHASIAFAGIGKLVTERPDLVRVLAVVAAAVIVVYAVFAWRARATKKPVDPPRRASGLGAGFLLTLPNPGALGAWVAVAASAWPSIDLGPAVVLGACVGVGSTAWFAVLSRFTFKQRERAVMRHIPRVALVLLVALASVGLVMTMVRA